LITGRPPGQGARMLARTHAHIIQVYHFEATLHLSTPRFVSITYFWLAVNITGVRHARAHTHSAARALMFTSVCTFFSLSFRNFDCMVVVLSVHLYTYTSIYYHASIHACMHTCRHTDKYTCIHVYLYVCMYVLMHTLKGGGG
jgi:hypothetical protein